MLRFTIPVTLLITCLSVEANDGAYLSDGSIIYPVNETVISLEKEILSFTCNDKISSVNIYFEFLNPEKTEKKILIGFQAPCPSGDVSFSDKSTPPIGNFKILAGDKLMPYKIKFAKCEDCELIETSEMVINENTTGIYVYLFEVTFKPGINVINHSYDFHASTHVYHEEMYGYIIRTGSKWAGKSIKDFTMQVDMGPDTYFFMRDVFTNSSSWKIIGTGKVTDKYVDIDKNSCRMIRISSGKLQINVKDFKPSNNVQFGIFRDHCFFSEILDHSVIPDKISRAMISQTINFTVKPESYTIDDLKILRNAVYAQYGYAFKSKSFQDYFAQFGWYLPDPNLAEDSIKLSEREKSYINEIIEKEKFLSRTN